MSDFLATLAARVRPIAPPIAPRKASVFESPSIEPISAPKTSAEREARPAPGSPRNEDAVSETVAPAKPIDPTPIADTAAARNSTGAPILIAPIVPATSGTHFTNIGSEKIGAEKTFPVPPPLVVATPPLVAPAPQSLPSQPATIHTVLTEKIIPANTADHSAPPAKPHAAPSPPVPAFAPPTVRLIEPALRSPDSAHSAPAARTEPPAIRVTIGRVEVRAVVPAAPAPSPAPVAKKSNPVISLDDYLKLQSSRSSHS